MHPHETPQDQAPQAHPFLGLQESPPLIMQYPAAPLIATTSGDPYDHQQIYPQIPAPPEMVPTPDYEQLDPAFLSRTLRRLPASVQHFANNGYHPYSRPTSYGHPNGDARPRPSASGPSVWTGVPNDIRVRPRIPTLTTEQTPLPQALPANVALHQSPQQWTSSNGSAHVISYPQPSPPVNAPPTSASSSQPPAVIATLSNRVERFIRDSFPDGTPDYQIKQTWLREVMYSSWKHNNEQEPNEELLLRFAIKKIHAEKNATVWDCSFYVDGKRCTNSSTERSRQAVEHVRRHIKLEPYACAPYPCPGHPAGCDKRYSSQDVLKKHRAAKVICDQCGASFLAGNRPRHLKNNCQGSTLTLAIQ